MSNNRNLRGGRPIPGAFNAEFTPGQMVIGICLLIALMVGSFGAGILVAKMDPSFQKTAQVIDTTKPVSPELPTTKPEPTPPPPRNTPPAPATQAPAPAPTTPAPVPPLPPAPATAPAKADATSGPRQVTLPPLPSAPKNSNTPVEIPVKMPAPVVGDTPAKAEPAKTEPAKTEPAKPDTKTAAAVPPVSTLPPLPSATKPAPAKTETPPAPEAAKPEATKPTGKNVNAKMEEDLLEPISDPAKPASKPTAKPAPAAPASAPSGGGTFGIQVGAFPGANREAQAADLQKRVQASGLGAEVRPSKDKQYYRVLVTGYADRASAIKALNDLKQRPGFEKAFVQDLSKL